MAGVIRIKANTVTTLDCATAGCGYHVEFDPNKAPIPALTLTKRNLQADLKGIIRIYMECDNPETPHTNLYRIQTD